MKSKLLVFLAVTLIFASCKFFNSYGKKVKINDYVEIYYSGDSTTEDDAKKLGNYLAETWKEQTNKKSLQVIKQNGGYTVKMVVDVDKVKQDTTLNFSFLAMQMLFETQVYKGSKVTLILTDNKFKGFKTFESTTKDEQTKVNTDSLNTK